MNATILRLTEDQERQVAEAYAARNNLVLVSRHTFDGMFDALRKDPEPVGPCQGAVDCDWDGIVIVQAVGGGSWRACREHAAPFRKMTDRFVVIDAARPNRRTRA